MDEYLTQRNLIYESQSGFRSRFSPDTCLAYQTDCIEKETSLGKFVGITLLDLQKAFDTVDDEILYNKFGALGFDLDSVNWFKSYLEKRLSDSKGISCGVSKGSVLDSLLFLVYVNDMESAID